MRALPPRPGLRALLAAVALLAAAPASALDLTAT